MLNGLRTLYREADESASGLRLTYSASAVSNNEIYLPWSGFHQLLPRVKWVHLRRGNEDRQRVTAFGGLASKLRLTARPAELAEMQLRDFADADAVRAAFDAAKAKATAANTSAKLAVHSSAIRAQIGEVELVDFHGYVSPVRLVGLRLDAEKLCRQESHPGRLSVFCVCTSDCNSYMHRFDIRMTNKKDESGWWQTLTSPLVVIRCRDHCWMNDASG